MMGANMSRTDQVAIRDLETECYHARWASRPAQVAGSTRRAIGAWCEHAYEPCAGTPTARGLATAQNRTGSAVMPDRPADAFPIWRDNRWVKVAAAVWPSL
jgi:hypothetical protein